MALAVKRPAKEMSTLEPWSGAMVGLADGWMQPPSTGTTASRTTASPLLLSQVLSHTHTHTQRGMKGGDKKRRELAPRLQGKGKSKRREEQLLPDFALLFALLLSLSLFDLK